MTIEEIYQRTAHIPSSVWEPEQQMWYELLKDLPGHPIIVDFGTGWGKSASSLALACPQGWVYTYDIGTVHINSQRSTEQYCQEVEDYIKKAGAENVSFTLQSSLEVNWTREIDVLNIDSDHTYETTLKEINRWVPFVKSGGYVFFHDFDHPRCPGVRQAIDELIPSKHNLEFQKATQAGEVKCAFFIKR